jgi:serine/threonine-protein kinase
MERKTCPSCGAAIEADRAGGLCLACLLNEGLRAEGMTAAPLPQCHACQSTLAEDARFCARCGTPVPAEPAAEGDHVRAALEAKLHAQYRIVRLLGRGGMGAVYLARDLALDREVAIKVLKADSSAREVQEQLRREARTAARLSHPNVVPLHAFGELEGMPYFVMGYVRGESLAARLRRDGRLPEEDARRILADLADALQHAHRQGVVHRDVKPDNVLLDDDSGRALLTDFGVARALGGSETLTAAGKVVGTPSYMSPEQAAGRADIDGRSDIYSLGVMAYAMLSGRLPFEGKTLAEARAAGKAG